MVSEKAAKILAEIIDVDWEEITLETDLIKEYDLKAVDVAKLVVECEKKFKIIIHDEDVHTFRTLNDIVEYIKRIQSDR